MGNILDELLPGVVGVRVMFQPPGRFCGMVVHI